MKYGTNNNSDEEGHVNVGGPIAEAQHIAPDPARRRILQLSRLNRGGSRLVVRSIESRMRVGRFGECWPEERGPRAGSSADSSRTDPLSTGMPFGRCNSRGG